MILAAGRGERMRPLTDIRPKPLLKVAGKALIEWHIEALAKVGIEEIVVNHAHLGKMIEEYLGDGSRYGVKILYSAEEKALETAGGIANALHLLGKDAFVVVNADIFCDIDFADVAFEAQEMARLILVDNPSHHPQGDFSFANGKIGVSGNPMLTFSGIGLYRPDFFSGIEKGQAARLAPLLRAGIEKGLVSAMYYGGKWVDVGTPARLEELNGRFA